MMARPYPRLSAAVAAVLTIAGCALPQGEGSNSPSGPGSPVSAQDMEHVRFEGPHVWPVGGNAFDNDMFSVAADYDLMLQFPDGAARRVERCRHRVWGNPLYRRMCVALDYMVHRDQRFHARARLVARDPYFGESAYLARVHHDIPWGGFRSPDEFFEFNRMAWSYVEPKTINRLHLQDLHYLDGPHG